MKASYHHQWPEIVSKMCHVVRKTLLHKSKELLTFKFSQINDKLEICVLKVTNLCASTY